MENERKVFECRVAGHDLTLRLGNCAVVLFRTNQEVDYLAIDLENEDEQTLRVFNNPSFVRWMAGYRLTKTGDNYDRPQVLNFEGSPDSFRELTGWNPPVIEKEEPNEAEMEMFLDVNTGNLDAEWQGMGET